MQRSLENENNIYWILRAICDGANQEWIEGFGNNKIDGKKNSVLFNHDRHKTGR